MKKYVRSELESLVPIRRITVDVIFERITPVAAATEIKPLQHPDGSDDIVALEDYESFIINALGVFSNHDYEVLEERDSPYSHSYYCTLVKKDQLEDADFKYILFIRISDHHTREATKSQTRKFYDSEANRLKQPQTKAKQTWRLKEITVNNQTYFSYEDALVDIDKRLD